MNQIFNKLLDKIKIEGDSKKSYPKFVTNQVWIIVY